MYPYYPTNPSSYEFLTDFGITYIVEFSQASFYFDKGCAICDRMETVSFGPIALASKVTDHQVSPTIVEIIKNRCRQRQGAVVFICDSVDSKEVCRSRLFGKWNSRFNGEVFHFQPAIIEYPDGILYVGLIVEKANPEAQLFIDDFTREAFRVGDKE